MSDFKLLLWNLTVTLKRVGFHLQRGIYCRLLDEWGIDISKHILGSFVKASAKTQLGQQKQMKCSELSYLYWKSKFKKKKNA